MNKLNENEYFSGENKNRVPEENKKRKNILNLSWEKNTMSKKSGTFLLKRIYFSSQLGREEIEKKKKEKFSQEWRINSVKKYLKVLLSNV